MCLEDILVVVIVIVLPILFARRNEHVPDAGEYHFDQMALFHGVFSDDIRREELHTDMDESRWYLTGFEQRFVDERLRDHAVETQERFGECQLGGIERMFRIERVGSYFEFEIG